MKKIISIVLVLVLMVAAFAGCSASKAIIGTWRTEQQAILNIKTEVTYTFNEDGTCSAPAVLGAVNVDGTYTIDGDKLSIQRGDILDAVSGVMNYTFKVSGKTLTLTAEDGTVITLDKVTG